MTRIGMLAFAIGLGLAGIALGCLAIVLGTPRLTRLEETLRPIGLSAGALAVVMCVGGLALYGVARLLPGRP